MLGGTRTHSGNLSPALTQNVDKLVEEFEAAVEESSKANGVRRAVVRSRLACNTIVVLTDRSVYLACERSSGGIPSAIYLDHTGKEFSEQQVLDAAIWEFGYRDPFVLRLPRNLLEEQAADRQPAVHAIAQQWVDSEARRVTMLSQLVTIDPLFGPPGYRVNPELCFVLMPFADDLDAVYRDIVKPTVESLGLVCKRADEIRSNDAIMRDIWKSICEARLIVADLTNSNANVFYELGIAHTLGKPTILLCQSSDARFPFDVMHLRRVSYENTASGGQRLEKELRETVTTVLQRSTSAVG